jgi:outer membrane protein assembly factor BamB
MKNKLYLLLILTLIYSGCSDVAPIEPHIGKHISADNYRIKILWDKMDIVLTDNSSYPTLVSADNIVILEGHNRDEPGKFQIFAYQANDGQSIWNIATPSYPSSVLIADSVYYRGSGGGQIQAFELSTGNLLWKTKLPGARSVIDLYVYDDKIVAQTNNDKEYTLLKTDGQILQGTTIKNYSFFRIHNLTFIKKYNAIEAVENSSGTVSWRVDVNHGIGFAPLLDNDNIYVVSKGVPNEILSVDRKTGNVNWQRNAKTISNLCILDSRIYFLEEDGSLVSLDKGNGEIVLTINFSPGVNWQAHPGGYYVACDTSANILVVSYGDNDQVIGLQFVDK